MGDEFAITFDNITQLKFLFKIVRVVMPSNPTPPPIHLFSEIALNMYTVIQLHLKK